MNLSIEKSLRINENFQFEIKMEKNTKVWN